MMNQGSSPWTKFMKRHERSYTCENQEFDSVYERLQKISIETDERYQKSDPFAQQQPRSTSTISTNKQSMNQSKKYPVDIRSSVGSTHPVRGNITTRGNKLQPREKTPQDISRDLEKVQRIIEIDQDIMKSQIKNLNCEYRNKKQCLESENRVLAERVQKLEYIVLDDKKEILKLRSMFEEMVGFVKGKFSQQAEVSNGHAREIKELRGDARIMSINKRATNALERSLEKRNPHPLVQREREMEKQNERGMDKITEQKYVQRIKLLEYQLMMKSKQLKEEKEKAETKIPFEIDNSLTFDIQKNTKSSSEPYDCSFSKNDRSIESIMICCEELSSLSHKLLMSTISDQSLLEGLDRKLQDGLTVMKDLIGANRDFSMLSMKPDSDFQAYGIN